MASPIVSVLKGKDGRDGIRLAIDYRYLNRYCLGDAYPMPDIADLLQRVGQAKYISSFLAHKHRLTNTRSCLTLRLQRFVSVHTFHGETRNVSSAESRVLYTRVDSTVSPLRRQKHQIIVSAQPESL